ncbi:AAA family ATPase [Chloroflexota bacterium]
MVPAKLTLRNFMCYRGDVPSLDFSGIHVASLSGENGAGKSTLLDAITWALWGQARARSDDDLIHIGQREMEVEYEFYVGSDKYRVIRKRSKSKSGATSSTLLELQQESDDGFRSITENTVRETQGKIIEILRLDYQTFINSAYLMQGRADEFTVKLPSERKKVLAEILGLSFYDELERRAREKARKSKDELGRLESAMFEIDRELANKGTYQQEIEQINDTLSVIDAEATNQETEVNNLRHLRKEMEFKEEKLKDIEKRLVQVERQLHDLDIQLKDKLQRIEKYENVSAKYVGESEKLSVDMSKLGESETELKSKKEKQQELSNLVHHLKSTNARLKEEMADLKSKIDMLNKDGANCPLCRTELGVEGHDNIVSSYQTEGEAKGDQYRQNDGKIGQAESELQVLNSEVGNLESRLTSERVSLERKREMLNREHAEAEEQLPKMKEGLARAEEAVTRWRTTVEEDTKTRQVLSSELVELPQLDQKLNGAETIFRESQIKQRQWRDRLVANEEKLRRCEDLEKTKKQKGDRWRKASEQKGIYDELVVAFGRKGIQALIIESALPELEQEADRLLGRMTDNRMNIRFESQRAKKTKRDEVEETLDINISDELGTRNYEMYSGGEAFRINFALRIALSKLLARRHGAPLPTLIIDEGFGTQDNAGKEKVVEAINSIQHDFEKIIVITHIDELKDAFETRIQVTKTDEGSTVEVVNF